MSEPAPKLSVVVTVVSDTTAQADARHLEACLAALEQQENAPSMEIIVTCDARLVGLAAAQNKFPSARFVVPQKLKAERHGASREHHDELRGIGIRAARGEIIALLEDVGRPARDWAANLLQEHAAPHAAIGGAMENEVDRPLNWAVYFCDFGRYQNPVPRGVAPQVSDANVSYKRAALERVAVSWAESYNETRVHGALHAAGEQLWLTPDVVVYQHRMGLQLGSALQERLVWGRSYAATRMAGASFAQRLVRVALSPLLPFVLTLRYFCIARQRGRTVGAFVRCSPIVFLLTVWWALGECTGYLTGRTN